MATATPDNIAPAKSRRPPIIAIVVLAIALLGLTITFLVLRPAAPIYALEESLTDSWVAEGGEITEEGTMVAQQALERMIAGDAEITTHPENEGLGMMSDLVDGYMVMGIRAERGMGDRDFQESALELEEQTGVRFGTASDVTGGDQYLVVALALGDLMKVTINDGDLLAG